MSFYAESAGPGPVPKAQWPAHPKAPLEPLHSHTEPCGFSRQNPSGWPNGSKACCFQGPCSWRRSAQEDLHGGIPHQGHKQETCWG